jgi:hypothetical protein
MYVSCFLLPTRRVCKFHVNCFTTIFSGLTEMAKSGQPYLFRSGKPRRILVCPNYFFLHFHLISSYEWKNVATKLIYILVYIQIYNIVNKKTNKMVWDAHGDTPQMLLAAAQPIHPEFATLDHGWSWSPLGLYHVSSPIILCMVT